MKEKGIENKTIEDVKRQGKTIVFVLGDINLIRAIALTDVIREKSREAIAKLKEMGIKCFMLTGDNKFVAKWVAEEIKLDNYFAEVLPHKEAEKIKEVQMRYVTAMVGDGVNDGSG